MRKFQSQKKSNKVFVTAGLEFEVINKLLKAKVFKRYFNKKRIRKISYPFFVRQRRFELPSPFGHYHLKVARLPISPPPYGGFLWFCKGAIFLFNFQMFFKCCLKFKRSFFVCLLKMLNQGVFFLISSIQL